ncbi:hypothetical protein [Bdellovibrio sp. HCB337]|uniref:hypothetical protein n=1 Tax=Bdellovibrio sp. HCB337 TaxID=3394358 RepID=UPI0039A51174
MVLVKVLEKKAVIRLFGLAMILAPFVNTVAKMALLTEIPNRWTFSVFWKIIMVGSTLNQILYVATLAIGFVMLRGKSSGWKFALVLLGGYIALQISDFGHVRTSAITWFFFITNVAAFLFIADQLVWKIEVPKRNSQPQAKAPEAKPVSASTPKPIATTPPPTAPPPAKPAPTVATASTTAAKPTQQPVPPKPAPPKEAPRRAVAKLRKKILFQFEGKDPWAQLMGVSDKGIHLRRLSEPPADIATREIEIPLGNGLTLRTRFARRAEHDYYFDYTSLSSEQIKSLNKWLYSLSDVA